MCLLTLRCPVARRKKKKVNKPRRIEFNYDFYCKAAHNDTEPFAEISINRIMYVEDVQKLRRWLENFEEWADG